MEWTDALLSIKPEYVSSIFSRKKTFEFRRSMFKKDVQRVFIYSTAPVKKITGSFVVNDILVGEPEELWARCKNGAGLESDDFFAYFDECDKGYAIAIGDVNKFRWPVDPNEAFKNFVPPQSFRYIPEGTRIR